MSTQQVDFTRSNAVGFFIGGATIAIAWTGAAILSAYSHPNLARSIAMVGFACFFACIGLAELRSGWTWKNMSPSGCGYHYSEHPHWYWLSVTGHFLIFIAIVVVAILVAFYHPEQGFDGTIRPGTAPH